MRTCSFIRCKQTICNKSLWADNHNSETNNIVNHIKLNVYLKFNASVISTYVSIHTCMNIGVIPYSIFIHIYIFLNLLLKFVALLALKAALKYMPQIIFHA